MNGSGDNNRDGAAANTDRELWREREGDYYAPSLFVTQGGGIGIDVGGNVIVRPIREWHRMAQQEAQTWRPIETAPKDGTEVRLPLVFTRGAPAFWCTDLKRWVLSRPLHMEFVARPNGWQPARDIPEPPHG